MMNRITEETRHRTSKGAIIGIILILGGIALIARQFDVFPFRWHHLIFTWQTLLIVIGVIIVSSREKVTGYILMGVGAFFLLPEIIDVPFGYRHMFWPIILIIMGLIIIFKGTGLYRTHHFTKWSDDADIIDDINFFGGGDKQITSTNFKGGSIISVFGGGKYDLRHATISKDKCVIEMVNVFGGSNLIVPSDWNVKIEVVGIFGGFSDKRHIIEPDNEKTLIIKGVAVFGGGDIKNV